MIECTNLHRNPCRSSSGDHTRVERSAPSSCATIAAMSELLTQAQIAALENRCERTVARWRSVDHSFPKPIALPCGGRVLFHRADYERWRARRDHGEHRIRHLGSRK